MSEIVQVEKDRIVSELQSFQQDISETSLSGDTNRLAMQLQDLAGRLRTIRQQGYVFAADLDKLMAALNAQWQTAQAGMRTQIQQVHERFAMSVSNLQSSIMERLIGADAVMIQAYVPQIESEISRLRSDLQNAKKSIAQPIGNIPDQITAITAHITEIERFMKHMAGASFMLNADEGLFIAATAEWKKGKDKKENPDGILFVTSRRVIMEQNEKSGGFMGIGGNKIQQLLWEIPLEGVQSITAEKTGLLGNVDLVHIRTTSGTPAPEVTVEVKDANANWFATQVQRAVHGDLTQDRIPAA